MLYFAAMISARILGKQETQVNMWISDCFNCLASIQSIFAAHGHGLLPGNLNLEAERLYLIYRVQYNSTFAVSFVVCDVKTYSFWITCAEN